MSPPLFLAERKKKYKKLKRWKDRDRQIRKSEDMGKSPEC